MLVDGVNSSVDATVYLIWRIRWRETEPVDGNFVWSRVGAFALA